MNHQLIHGDCLEAMAAIPDGSVDMVFADLPYAHVTASGKVRKCTANAWDAPIDLAAMWSHFLRVGTPQCAFVFTATQPFATALICSQPKFFRYDLVWEKTKATGVVNARIQPLRCHESVLVFSRYSCISNAKLKMVFHPQRTDGTPYKRTNARRFNPYSQHRTKDRTEENVTGLRCPRSVLTLSPVSSAKQHPTQKPVALLEWLIKTYSNPGDTILDPTFGSCTTGAACINTGRCFIGIEKDATYFEMGRKRMAEAAVQATQPLRRSSRQQSLALG